MYSPGDSSRGDALDVIDSSGENYIHRELSESVGLKINIYNTTKKRERRARVAAHPFFFLLTQKNVRDDHGMLTYSIAEEIQM